MTLASLIERYLPELEARYGDRLLPVHYRAISAIQRCRTIDAGEILWHCQGCGLDGRQPRSCGHRSCPHCHVIVPGGGLDKNRKQWHKLKSKYLFNGKALARAFRGKMLAAIDAAGLQLPKSYPRKWVVKCHSVGHGEPALKYLSRYLYRGVIAEQQIVNDRDGQVTFRYRESGSGKIRYRTLAGAEFLWLVIQHVLPKGFRRVRDVGILHGKSRCWLQLVQRILSVIISPTAPRERPYIICPRCQLPMQAIGFIRPAWQSG